ncbi:MAG: PqqD family protein [Clostridia bacterium]|nr:PqqD family protein [Clostridia bacterium]
MRLKEGFILKKILDDYIVVPTGDNIVDFAVAVSLNESGAFLWEQLSEEKTIFELADALASEYNVSSEEVIGDVAEFAELLKTHDFLAQ